MNDNRKLKILFVTSEVWPYSKVGGLGDVAGALTYALRDRGHDVRIISPYYQAVEDNHYTDYETGSFGVSLRGVWHDLSLRLAVRDGLPHYFIENPFFFRREHIYSYFDDGERFTVFCRGALEAARKLNWRPDIIHCNDWQTGLIPALLKTTLAQDPFFENTATIFSIHNLAYQGTFPPYFVEVCDLPGEVFHFSKGESYGSLNFMKMGITYADRVNTVSPTYAREILTEEFGEKLDTHLVEHQEKLHGIINGLDVERFDPATDPGIASNYSRDDVSGKAACKKALMDELDLQGDPGLPLVVMISRLTSQKGFDLLAGAMKELMAMDIRLAVLGEGDRAFMDMLESAQWEFPGRVRARFGFDAALARRLYAGGDVFLMPSHYEPCGIGQMIAMRYGTVPVVRAVGGLADTVRSFSPRSGSGNGVVFRSYTSDAMLEAVKKALSFYADCNTWTMIMRNGMSGDFSWRPVANEYEQMYRLAMA